MDFELQGRYSGDQKLAVVGKERPEVLALERMVVFDRCRTTFLEDRRRKED